MEAAGAEIPKAQIDDAWQWIWRAWWRLHRDRPRYGGGMGPTEPGRIPWRMVVEWCQFYGHDVEFLDGMIGVLDNVYFVHYAKTMKT